MASRSVRGRPLPDRLEALDEVISISSDSEYESNIDDDDELTENGAEEMSLAHDSNPDDSLPSISAIVASMPSSRPARTESIGKHLQTGPSGAAMAGSRQGVSTQELYVRGKRGISDSYYPNLPTEAASFSSSPVGHPIKASEPTKCVDGSIELDSSTREQHDAGMSSSSCSPRQKTSVQPATGQRLFEETASSQYQGDEGPHHQHSNSDTAPACMSKPACPPRPQNPSMASSNHCIPNHIGDTDHSHGVVATPRSDTNLGEMIRSPSTQISRAGHTKSALNQENSVDGNQPQSSRDSSPFTICPSSSSGERREENHGAMINVDNIASQLDGPGDKFQSQLYGLRTPGSGYNLRPSPVKRQYEGEELVTGKHTSPLPLGKRRKPEGCASPRQRSVRQKTGLSQDQISVLTKKNKSIRDGSPFTRRPKQPTNTSFEELPIDNAVLKCVREDGLATFQLQLTWSTSSRADNAQYQPRAKRGLPFSTLRGHSLKAGKGSFKQHAETDASVCQMDSLLVRWRKHIFLVKWYDHSGAVVTTWEPRKNILDKRMLVDFEAKWRGFDKGVDVLRTRRRGGKRPYLLHWHGRSSKEDTWLNEDLLSPQLIDRHKENVSNV